jgi:PleD family two-component response regulator
MSRRIKHIFYLDDDVDDHLLFLLALQEVKPVASLHSFYNSQELLEYLKNEHHPRPDVIFLDQNMHGNRKNECLQEIGQLLNLRHIPVIMYATSGDPDLVGNALGLGIHSYVIKPILQRDIKENLALLISECEQL